MKDINDHADHFEEQVELFKLIRAEFEAQHRRDPRFCIACGFDGMVIANLVALEWHRGHAESDEDRREFEQAIVTLRMSRASQDVEHRA